MDDEIISDDDLVPDLDNQDEEGGDSTVFVEEHVRDSTYIENVAVSNIIELFSKESQLRLSAFLRKKIFVKFDTIGSCLFQDIDHDYTKLLMLNFHVFPHEKHGLITFDFVFLHSVINLLYGGVVNSNETIMRGLGKSGFKIAGKVSEIFLAVLQEAMIEHLKIHLKISDVSTQLSSVFKQGNSEKCYNISFLVIIDSLVCNLNLVIPENMFSNRVLEADSGLKSESEFSEETIDSHEMVSPSSIFDEKTKKELIDSNVMVSVNLAKITLKLKDVVNLKAGDVIPIGDPTVVYVALNNKNLFKASAGQSNLRRAVKIVDKL